MPLKRLILGFIMILGTMLGASAYTQTIINGVVVDSVSGDPIPYAAIFMRGTNHGIVADENGHFTIKTDRGFISMDVTALGFDPKSVKPRLGMTSNETIRLVPSGVKLREVYVKPGKEHYSKKNNPAVDFVNRLRSRQDLTDPRENPYYQYDRYERITLGLNEFDVGDETEGKGGGWMIRKFPFMKDYVDTSEISGKTILNLSTREKASTVYWRNDPKTQKEVVSGLHSAGIDDMLDPTSLQTFYEDVMREVDIYNNDINIFQNRFVSPLARIAPDFYKFYLTDTVTIDSTRCVELTFVPHTAESFGFVGRLYVPVNDSTMFVKRIVMNTPRNINLNFIETLRIIQDYDRAPDGRRWKKSDDMIVEARLLPGTQGMYARRNTTYSHHSYQPPADPSVFNSMARVITGKEAKRRDESFWNDKRTSDISHGENSVGSLMERMRQEPVYYWTEKFLKIMVSGYIQTARDSKIDIGPMNTVISHNDVEGWRLRAGGMTTANLSRRWFSRAYVAWGTKDHRWKYMVEGEYSFRDKDYHSREFPVHSLRATHLYDVDMIGQHYLFTNPDNMFLSIKRHKDLQMTYHRLSKLEYTLELENNFSVVAGIHNDRQMATTYMPFVNGAGESFGHLTATSFKIQLRYAPGEKFYQTKSHRFPINLDAPVVMLTHEYAPGGGLGNRFTINKTELKFQKRFWFSAFGYTDVILGGGHVWSKVPYINLLIPNANLSYTIQPESFALMNPMEFINDSYASWDITYWANGAILNYIPLIKKLKLRESFSFRGLWGHLSDRNNPELDPSLMRFPEIANTVKMSNTPYMEVGVGLDNIFRILRLDYVWRLTYRDLPGISRSGLRLALHFTF